LEKEAREKADYLLMTNDKLPITLMKKSYDSHTATTYTTACNTRTITPANFIEANRPSSTVGAKKFRF